MNQEDSGAVVLGSRWRDRESELAFVTRSVAGALSRAGQVAIVTPSPAGVTEPDGAFDLIGIGVGTGGGWPEPEAAHWTPRPDQGSAWILDETDNNAEALLDSFGVARAYSVSPVPEATGAIVRNLPFTEGPKPLGVHVPVNPLANSSRHTGLGFTGYVLVLSDRPGGPSAQPPTPAVAWLTARFYDSHIVVVEGGKAAAWKGRALRGVVSVDSRTDLWRLLAHAVVTVDLAPGAIIARECIESLRLGTPIVVPEGTTASLHARAGGGRTFADEYELLDAVECLSGSDTASETAARGREYADEHYGNADGFVLGVNRAVRAS